MISDVYTPNLKVDLFAKQVVIFTIHLGFALRLSQWSILYTPKKNEDG